MDEQNPGGGRRPGPARVGNGAGAAGALLGLGLVAHRRGDQDLALRRLRDAAARSARLGDWRREGAARQRAAASLRALGRSAAADEEPAAAALLLAGAEERGHVQGPGRSAAGGIGPHL